MTKTFFFFLSMPLLFGQNPLPSSVNVGGGGGDTGNVVGPASSTKDCAALYADTTGKLLEDSTICKNSIAIGGVTFSGTPGSGGGLVCSEGTAWTGAASQGVIYCGTDHLWHTILNNGTDYTICLSGGAGACGSGSPFAATGETLYGSLNPGTVFTLSPTANQMSYTPIFVNSPGRTITGVSFLINSATADSVSACIYDVTGALVTNGQGSTVVTAGNATFASPTFTTVTLTPGIYFLGLVSHNNAGATTLYAGSTYDGGWGISAANAGLTSSTYVFFRGGNSGASLATGTTTLVCPSSIPAASRLIVGALGGGTASNAPIVALH